MDGYVDNSKGEEVMSLGGGTGEVEEREMCENDINIVLKSEILKCK